MNDKEGRKWLLQKLYDNGVKYIVFSNFYNGYVGAKNKPVFGKNGEVMCAINHIITFGDLLPDFNEPNYLDIGKYLGIVDWSKVAVDTPILVRDLPAGDVRRYFKEYKDGKVYYFSGGRTSWSCVTSEYTYAGNARLAGGGDEK